MMSRKCLSEETPRERDTSFADTENTTKFRQRQAIKKRKLYEVKPEDDTGEPGENKQFDLPVQSMEEKYEPMAQDLEHGMDADVPEGKEVPGNIL